MATVVPADVMAPVVTVPAAVIPVMAPYAAMAPMPMVPAAGPPMTMSPPPAAMESVRLLYDPAFGGDIANG